MRIALTGGTGFLGTAVMRELLARGHDITALARRPQPDRERVRWVIGDLSDSQALAAIVDGADAVLHVAGAVNLPTRAAFAEANVEGTRRLVEAAQSAGTRHFVLVSSLSAREPQLSDYGWSKREGERLVEASALDWTIVRPPAIYGPEDRELLDMFRAAARGVVPLPPRGKLSLIHVDDLARLLVALVEGGGAKGATLEPDDGTPGGLTHVAFAKALGRATGRKVLALSLARPLLLGAAHVDRWWRGSAAKLTPDRARYFCHADWVSDPGRAVPRHIWTPMIAVEQGLGATAQAYRAKGWL